MDDQEHTNGMFPNGAVTSHEEEMVHEAQVSIEATESIEQVEEPSQDSDFKSAASAEQSVSEEVTQEASYDSIAALDGFEKNLTIKETADADEKKDEITEIPIVEGDEDTDDETELGPNWASSAKRFEWKDSYGDVAPRIRSLEHTLFGKVLEERGKTGLNFQEMCMMNVEVVNAKEADFIGKFEDAGLHPVMRENVQLCGYKVPTPIQAYCIPAILQGHDILACAQTGSGKTAAFLVPIISKLLGKTKKLAKPRPDPNATRPYKAEPLILVMAPTRELVTQIFHESRRFCYRSMLRPCVVYGGASFVAQREELEKGCDLLVATPGRLLDFIEKGRSLSLRRIKYAVIDEADQMMDMGFGPTLRQLFLQGDMNQDDDLQITMFSATYPIEIQQLAKDFLSEGYIQIAVGRIGSTHSTIKQRIVWVEEEDKPKVLANLLLKSPPARTLIFANNKSTVDTLDSYLYNDLAFPCTSIHSGRTQREREDALRAFKIGRCPILLATSVAARGLDIKGILHVINYDLPHDIDEYVHRIGRTARIGNLGIATTFYNRFNMGLAADLAELLEEAKQEVPDFIQSAREQSGGVSTYRAKRDADRLGMLGMKDQPGEAPAEGGAEGDTSASGWGMDDPAPETGNDNWDAKLQPTNEGTDNRTLPATTEAPPQASDW